MIYNLFTKGFRFFFRPPPYPPKKAPENLLRQKIEKRFIQFVYRIYTLVPINFGGKRITFEALINHDKTFVFFFRIHKENRSFTKEIDQTLKGFHQISGKCCPTFCHG